MRTILGFQKVYKMPVKKKKKKKKNTLYRYFF